MSFASFPPPDPPDISRHWQRCPSRPRPSFLRYYSLPTCQQPAHRVRAPAPPTRMHTAPQLPSPETAPPPHAGRSRLARPTPPPRTPAAPPPPTTERRDTPPPRTLAMTLAGALPTTERRAPRPPLAPRPLTSPSRRKSQHTHTIPFFIIHDIHYEHIFLGLPALRLSYLPPPPRLPQLALLGQTGRGASPP